jgi:N-acyl amino acid synthase of PEP-CTERM/exosortase system
MSSNLMSEDSMTSGNQTLIESFKVFFSVEFAITAEQKRKIFSVRYRVYCDEFKYESPENFPDKQESDEFDDHSLLCLITHKESNIPAGCVRLVPTTGISGDSLLPFEKYCSDSLDSEFIKGLNLERHNICEISRLAVDGVFRRRSGETSTRFGDVMSFTDQEKRTFSLIAVAGFLAATALTELSGRTNVFAMMEPFLPRLWRKFGMNFQKAGSDIDYHGVRAPYFIKTQSALDDMDTELKTLYFWLKDQIEVAYRESL